MTKLENLLNLANKLKLKTPMVVIDDYTVKIEKPVEQILRLASRLGITVIMSKTKNPKKEQPSDLPSTPKEPLTKNPQQPLPAQPHNPREYLIISPPQSPAILQQQIANKNKTICFICSKPVINTRHAFESGRAVHSDCLFHRNEMVKNNVHVKLDKQSYGDTFRWPEEK